MVQGKPEHHRLYGWDNEYGHQKVEVAEFKAARFPVTNHEFREFMEAGGYTERRYWTQTGWDWQIRQGSGHHPEHWRRDDTGRVVEVVEKVVV